MIRLNVFIQVEAANRAALLAEAKALVEKSLNDEGCVAYDVFESATRQDVMMICETWRDEQALCAPCRKHGKTRQTEIGKIPVLTHSLL